MPSDDFNEFIDDAAQAIKKAIGPFSGLLNPQSTQKDKAKIVEQEERIARQDRQIDTLLDGVEQAKNAQREAELERDALRDQNAELLKQPTAASKPGLTPDNVKLVKIGELVEQADTDKHYVGSDLLEWHYKKFWNDVQAVVRSA